MIGLEGMASSCARGGLGWKCGDILLGNSSLSSQKEQVAQGGDHPPVLGSGEAAPQVLCSALGPSVEEGH